MTTVAPADSTYAYIETLVRRLTASPSDLTLTSRTIQQVVNDIYLTDFPYGIKVDEMRSVYQFYTAPYIDKYRMDVNYYQGVRGPLYIDGIPGVFYKDRQEFFNLFPRWPTQFMPITGDGTTQLFTFSISATPFLAGQVTLGGNSTTGAPIQVSDDGLGNLQYHVVLNPSPVPAQNLNPNVPGMHNYNVGNPGLITYINIGTINYITGACTVNFSTVSVTPAAGQNMTMYVSQYTTGRPYSALFWNNEFTIRPVPKYVHQIQIESYQTPVQFMMTNDNPILNQWSKVLAYMASAEIMRYRNDFEMVNQLQEGLKRQVGLALERQAVNEIGQRNSTLFSSTTPNWGWNQSNQGFGY